jgi:hypothetical protein
LATDGAHGVTRSTRKVCHLHNPIKFCKQESKKPERFSRSGFIAGLTLNPQLSTFNYAHSTSDCLRRRSQTGWLKISMASASILSQLMQTLPKNVNSNERILVYFENNYCVTLEIK